ncbi:hypothetical protein KY338_00670 [Candidatus Woesearchaeota archaeon]|nr:hypothetical protein [Candidatus Woesearchaeota archaeon]MBW3005167.1 hypothetical protein [Candidatus Woesearchaeota archaeon]
MKNPILISTGNFWDGKNPLDNVEAIKKIRQLNVDGVEITFSDPKLLEGFFSNEVRNLLQKFKFVGMHLPRIKYQRNDKTRDVIKKCYCLYRLLKADYAILHMHWIKDHTLFKGTRWNIVIENGGSIHGYIVKDMQEFLKKNRRFKMVLDVNHAYESDEINEYVKKLKNKIYAVHLGGGEIPNAAGHKLFHKAPKEYLESCEPIKKLDCPIVIESNWGSDPELMKKELAFVRNWLKQKS